MSQAGFRKRHHRRIEYVTSRIHILTNTVHQTISQGGRAPDAYSFACFVVLKKIPIPLFFPLPSPPSPPPVNPTNQKLDPSADYPFSGSPPEARNSNGVGPRICVHARMPMIGCWDSPCLNDPQSRDSMPGSSSSTPRQWIVSTRRAASSPSFRTPPKAPFPRKLHYPRP